MLPFPACSSLSSCCVVAVWGANGPVGSGAGQQDSERPRPRNAAQPSCSHGPMLRLAEAAVTAGWMHRRWETLARVAKTTLTVHGTAATDAAAALLHQPIHPPSHTHTRSHTARTCSLVASHRLFRHRAVSADCNRQHWSHRTAAHRLRPSRWIIRSCSCSSDRRRRRDRCRQMRPTSCDTNCG